MDWKKAIGFGSVLWILMFVIVSIFVAFKIEDYIWMKVIIAITAGVISFILAKFSQPLKMVFALGYGVSWVVVGAILDALVTTRFAPEIFKDWGLWLGYALVILAPLIVFKFMALPKVLESTEDSQIFEAAVSPKPEVTQTSENFESQEASQSPEISEGESKEEGQ